MSAAAKVCGFCKTDALAALESLLTQNEATEALQQAASDALSWIENYPLNGGFEFTDDWRAVSEALAAALAASAAQEAGGA